MKVSINFTRKLPVIKNRLGIVSFLSGYMADPLPIEVNAIPFNDMDVPKGLGKGSTIPVLPTMQKYLQKMQSAEAYRWVVAPRMLWINRDDFRAECIGAGYGNYVEIIGETDNFFEIAALAHDDPMLYDPLTFNWRTHPHLFGKATARRKDFSIVNVGAGLDCYIPIIKQTPHLWIHKSYAELLPPRLDGYILHGASVYTADMQPLRLARKPGELVHPSATWRLSTGSVIPPAT